jgi:uncharacterized protein YcbK (DUF882 family)
MKHFFMNPANLNPANPNPANDPRSPGIKVVKLALWTSLILYSASVSITSWAAQPADSLASRQTTNERSLSFFHTHTDERLDIVYYRRGEYADAALDRINHFLRDFRTGDIANIDRNTLDIVHDIKQQLNYGGDVHIVSAYRSAKTNEMLRQKSNGVAKKSQHLDGKAIDFRLPGVDTAKLRDLAKALQKGGVGYYHSSDFIHVDSGRVRYW